MSNEIDKIVDGLKKQMEALTARRKGASGDEAAIIDAEWRSIRDLYMTARAIQDRQNLAAIHAIGVRIEDAIARQRASGLGDVAQVLVDATGTVFRGLKERQEGRSLPRQQSGNAGSGAASVGTQVGIQAPPPAAVDAPPAVLAGAVRAKPGPFRDIITKIIDGADAAGADPLLACLFAYIESTFRSDAVGPGGSAGGLFQFQDNTWLEAGGSDPFNGSKKPIAAFIAEDTQIDVACKFIARRVKELAKREGGPPTYAKVYIAHQQGMGGYQRLFSTAPDRPVTDAISQEAARGNLLDGLTVGDAIRKLQAFVRRKTEELDEFVETGIMTPVEVASPLPLPLPALGSGIVHRPCAHRAVQIAEEELRVYGRRGDQTIVSETEEPLQDRIVQVYFPPVGVRVTAGNKEAWSAAFISHVFREAGADENIFPFSSAHAAYICRALDNRRKSLDAPLLFLDGDEAKPRAGDLIGMTREDKARGLPPLTRQQIENLLPYGFFTSHTDIVVAVDETKDELAAIGGNVGNTIGHRRLRLDQGVLRPALNDSNNRHWFVLRIDF